MKVQERGGTPVKHTALLLLERLQLTELPKQRLQDIERARAGMFHKRALSQLILEEAVTKAYSRTSSRRSDNLANFAVPARGCQAKPQADHRPGGRVLDGRVSLHGLARADQPDTSPCSGADCRSTPNALAGDEADTGARCRPETSADGRRLDFGMLLEKLLYAATGLAFVHRPFQLVRRCRHQKLGRANNYAEQARRHPGIMCHLNLLVQVALLSSGTYLAQSVNCAGPALIIAP